MKVDILKEIGLNEFWVIPVNDNLNDPLVYAIVNSSIGVEYEQTELLESFKHEGWPGLKDISEGMVTFITVNGLFVTQFKLKVVLECTLGLSTEVVKEAVPTVAVKDIMIWSIK